MAAEWSAVPFGEVLRAGVRNGVYKPKEFHGRGSKIVNMGELFAYPRLGNVPMRRVQLEPKEQAAFDLQPGDLLFARRSLVAEGAGKCCVVMAISEPTTFESSLIRARVEPAKADSLFLYYFFCSNSGKHALDSIRRHVAVAGITGSDLVTLKVPLPPLPVQRAISSVLGALDEKIESNQRTNETLEKLARTIFESWFVDFDPVRAKSEGRQPVGMDAETAALFPNRLVESELGELPEGWRAAPLSEWATTLSGGTPSKSNASLWGGVLPWISPKVMTAIHADETDAFVTSAALGNGTRLAPAGSTLVMVRGMGLHKEVRVSQARGDVTFNQDVKALVPRGIEPALLLFALLDAQPTLLGRVQSSGHGTGVLPSDILSAYPIFMPSPEVQKKLVAPLAAMNDRIGASRSESRTLAELRDLLLPKLISGELRVPTAEKMVEAAL